MNSWTSPCGSVELRLGRYQDVLRDVEAGDLGPFDVITDPPFSRRTHEGAEDAEREARLGYGHWTGVDIGELFDFAVRARWVCAMTDDVLAPWFRNAATFYGRKDFAPVPILQHRRRGTGDGPPSCAVYMMVSRPIEVGHFAQWYVPGWYEAETVRGGVVHGAKPVSLLERVICDYTRPGDLVVDPCAGGASTLIAAGITGRRAVGAEVDPETFAKAVERLEKGWTVDAFAAQVRAPRAKPMDLFGAAE